MDKATTRWLVRAAFAGLLAAAASLQAVDAIGWNDLPQAIIAGIIAAGALGGTEYVTPLNPNVGKGKG